MVAPRKVRRLFVVAVVAACTLAPAPVRADDQSGASGSTLELAVTQSCEGGRHRMVWRALHARDGSAAPNVPIRFEAPGRGVDRVALTDSNGVAMLPVDSVTVRATTPSYRLTARAPDGASDVETIDPRAVCWGTPNTSAVAPLALHTCSTTLHTARVRAQVTAGGVPRPNEPAYLAGHAPKVELVALTDANGWASVTLPSLPLRASTEAFVVTVESRGVTSKLEIAPKVACWGAPERNSVAASIATHSCARGLLRATVLVTPMFDRRPVPLEHVYGTASGDAWTGEAVSDASGVAVLRVVIPVQRGRASELVVEARGRITRKAIPAEWLCD